MLGVWRGRGGSRVRGCAGARARMRGRQNRVKFFLVSVKTFVEVKFLESLSANNSAHCRKIGLLVYPIPYHAKRYIS
jgi:hypothetical protein